MHRFDEHHAEFKGFSEYFDVTIAPALDEREDERGAKWKKAILIAALVACLVFIGSMGAFYVTRSIDILVVGLVGPFAVFVGVRAFVMRHISAHTKEVLVGGVLRHIGWAFEPEVKEFDYTAWLEAGLVPKGASIKSFEDRMSGPAHGAQFHSVEAHLQKRSGKNTITLFRGQLIWMIFGKPLGMGQTVVLRDKGFRNRKRHGDLKRVGLVDPVFEKIFEAYSNDQVGARVVLDPVFMQRMVDLEESLDGKNIRFAFDETIMLIAVETPNRFEAGDMSVSLSDPARAQRILDEVGAVFNIVDTLLAKPKALG